MLQNRVSTAGDGEIRAVYPAYTPPSLGRGCTNCVANHGLLLV